MSAAVKHIQGVLFAALLILLSSGAVPALAQVGPNAPVRQTVDANGVDLFPGRMTATGPVLSMGEGEQHGLAFAWINRGSGWRNSFMATLTVNSTTALAAFGGTTDQFTVSGSSFVSTEGNGATLSFNSTTNIYTYTARDGTIVHFDKKAVGAYPFATVAGVVKDIIWPSGVKLTYSLDSIPFCIRSKPSGGGYICTQHQNAYRIASAQNDAGYKIMFHYMSIEPYDPDSPTDLPDLQQWNTLASVSMTNSKVSGSPTPEQNWGYAFDGISASFNITDAAGGVTKFGSGPGGGTVARITYPGGTTPDVTVDYSGSRVSGVTNASGLTAYAFSDASGIRTVTATRGGDTTTYKFDIASELLTSVTDALGNTTSYVRDGSGRVTKVTYPEGNSVAYTYDARGNVTETRLKSKTPGTPADIVTSASYPATCTNPACNRPVWTKDAKGKQTDYTYNSTTGDVLTVTAPAPASGGTRPKTSYGYSSVGGVSMLSSISSCATGATCAGTAAETKVTIGYNGNLLPTSVTTAAGNGSVSATTAIAYDAVGNRTSVDGPLAGTGDTTAYRHDLLRRTVGVIGPDPDGTGPRVRAARRLSYNGRGQVTKTEVGTVTGTDNAAWSAFVTKQQGTTTYDAYGRATKQVATAGGTTYAVTQTSYDALGRVDCTAVRMNPAVWGSPPGACTAGTAGGAGADRIVKVALYDALGRPVEVTSAYGQAEASTQKTAYTANGQVAYVIDAENNRTGYTYDGFDRLVKTEYPSTTKGANAVNAGDYEQLGYDANGNVTSRRLRDGTSIAYTYDDLGRLTKKDLPGSEADISYSYDLLNRATGAVQGSQTLTFVQDALGRLTSQTGPLGTIGYTYDAAGRRLTMSYPGGVLTINYDYDVIGNVTKIRENGAISGVGVLAAYAYDDLGQATSVTFGNGSVQSFAYNTGSQLTTLTNDLGGAATTHDLTQTFSYNPAGQIGSVTRSNDAYAWQAHYNVDRNYIADGLNRIMSAGGVGFTYDARGNLTSDGTNAYTYTAENLLKTGPSSATLAYDPLGRLYETVGGGTTTRFQYDGADLIAEHNGSNAVQRRYVHGPGVDNPIVWYEGSAINNTTRRFLMADERGSVVSVTDSAGATITINAYDEYGIPAPGNIGRFGYTGQTWLPEVKMWYYKARIYAPTLGRFLQTDPIGYADGMNWYNYVGSDPVNFVDPAGLTCSPADGWRGCDGPPIDVYASCTRGWVCVPVEKLYSPISLSIPVTSTDAGSGGDIDHCRAAPTSAVERAASQRGDRLTYWKTRLAAGDPLATTALAIYRGTGFRGMMANSRLSAALFKRSPNMTFAQNAAEMQQIGVEIMRAHVAAVDRSGGYVTSAVEAQSHFDIFAAHHLPADTFGAAPLTGTQTEATLTSDIWMEGC